ncbi:hypothetical protein BCR33DRAFT_723878 [Rhizoclosmatium globosum]|uniref:Uncharacterized protein n=1 Tax=Rhizoclosmatium globosum TaxID=329046 RepID=A0A1Y2BAH9_9FUNG|nr:hypothetical protein BCR33DRAFT_723878 [Rhizoclosmatium globosum]|eukprot:ORY31530.1 hypothetical protein BCR33DRAFT_723878 [Rhizoclosmatium globosum]
MIATLAKGLLSLALLTPTIYFATLLFNAIATVPLSTGFQHILSNAWATSALIDYITAFPFIFPYVASRSNNTATSILLCACCFFLGNVFTVPLFIYWILSIDSPSIRAALLPHSQSTDPSTHALNGVISKRVLGVYTAITLVVFIGICVKALDSGDPGFDFILNDTWSLVTFVDVLVGVQLVILYVVVREGPKSVVATIGWVVGLVLLGNGATCVYVLYLLWSSGAGGVKEVFLGSGGERTYVRLD